MKMIVGDFKVSLCEKSCKWQECSTLQQDVTPQLTPPSGYWCDIKSTQGGLCK